MKAKERYCIIISARITSWNKRTVGQKMTNIMLPNKGNIANRKGKKRNDDDATSSGDTKGRQTKIPSDKRF